MPNITAVEAEIDNLIIIQYRLYTSIPKGGHAEARTCPCEQSNGLRGSDLNTFNRKHRRMSNAKSERASSFVNARCCFSLNLKDKKGKKVERQVVPRPAAISMRTYSTVQYSTSCASPPWASVCLYCYIGRSVSVRSILLASRLIGSGHCLLRLPKLERVETDLCFFYVFWGGSIAMLQFHSTSVPV